MVWRTPTLAHHETSSSIPDPEQAPPALMPPEACEGREGREGCEGGEREVERLRGLVGSSEVMKREGTKY